MQTAPYLLVAFFLGIVMSIYLPMNSSVSRYLGSSIAASALFYIVALATTLAIFVFSGEYQSLQKIKNVPGYLYLAGFISAFMIIGTTIIIPRIGARKFFILLVSGQILMAVLVSHLGILESPKDPVNIKKFIGAALVITGAALSTS
jgi:transporter family-2 protein